MGPVKFDLEKALTSRCLLIKGSDGLLVVQTLSDLLKAHKDSSDDVTPEAFASDSRPPSDWIGLASSASFFADIQVVVVRNAGRVPPTKFWDTKTGKSHPFASQIASLPDFSRLILVVDEEAGSPEKQSSAKEAGDKWAKLVEAGGGLVVSMDVDNKSTADFAIKEAKELGVTLSAAAAQKLSLMVGGQAGLARAELQKAVLYASPRKDIRESDLEKVVVAEPDYNIFLLAESMVKGEAGPALKELAVVISQAGTNVQGEALSRVLPMVHRQLRLVYQARICIENNCLPSNAPTRVTDLFPERYALHKEREWGQQKAMTLARRLTMEQVADSLLEVSRADAKLKGLLPSFSPREVLEEMTLRIAEACASKRRV